MKRKGARATPAAFVAAARGWIGTPFRHMGHQKGREADCVGLILGVARQIGVSDFSPRNYHRDIDCAYLKECLTALCRPLEASEPGQAGDLLQFTVHGLHQHLGIDTGEGSFIHAWEHAGCVTETELVGYWAGTVAGRWRIRALEGPPGGDPTR